MKRRFYLLIAVLALAAWALVTVLREGSQSGLKIGSPAPLFTLEDVEGRELSLEAFRGKVVLLNFWATWCGPCRGEMPSLEALYQKYRDQNFIVLGVSVDEEGWEPVREFLKQVPVHFPVLLDQEQQVGESYQTFRIPESYFIDPQGKIADKVVGPHNFDQEVFHQKVERLLGQAPATP